MFKKNGSLEGVWQGNNMTAVIKGNYTFTDGQGYCRVATVTLSNGVFNKKRDQESVFLYYLKATRCCFGNMNIDENDF